MAVHVWRACLGAVLLAVPLPAFATSLCQAGAPDDFSPAGVETTSATPRWETCMSNTTAGVRAEFDGCVIDHYVRQSFFLGSCGAADGDTTGSGTIVVTVRVRGMAGSATTNDYLILGAGNGALWGVTLNTLQCLRTNGADCTWSPGDTATFTVRLNDLPPSSASPFICAWPQLVTTLTAAVGDSGELDVGITDDTCVDYLAVRYDAAVPTRPRSWGSLKVLYH